MGNIDVIRAVDFIRSDLPRETWPHWNPGWPHESEAALLDAIFSARATYGTPTTGVRAVIERWRTHRTSVGEMPLDSLESLARFADQGDALSTIVCNRQRVAGNSATNAHSAAHAARALVTVGCTSSADIEDSAAQRVAVTSVPGLGHATFDTLIFLSGISTPASADLLARFTATAIGRDSAMTGDEVNTVLADVAHSLGVDAASLTHAAWRFQRRAERQRRPARPD